MRLIYSIPKSLQKQLEVNSSKLAMMSKEFNRVAAELSLFSFYETIDTKLRPDGNGKDVVIINAPIVSIKSAVLELHHEVERPLDAEHADCPAFGTKNNYAQESYLDKLERAVKKSFKLSKKFIKDDHTELDPKGEAKVEIHGFYEPEEKTVGSTMDNTPVIRLWSTKTPLKEFILQGPAQCLGEFIKASTRPPKSEPVSRDSDSQLLIADKSTHSNGRRVNSSPIQAQSSVAYAEINSSDELHRLPKQNSIAAESLLMPQESDDKRFGRSASVSSQRQRSPSATPLARPTTTNQKLTWVHLPFNNPTWCAVSNCSISQIRDH
jgi:hypothetical protein